MDTKPHSRAPWKFGRNIPTNEMRDYFSGGGHFIEIDSPTHGALAVVVWRMEDDERSPTQEANAHLIVAGPDLLDSLTVAERFMSGFEGDELQDGINEKLLRIRAAIVKATGVRS